MKWPWIKRKHFNDAIRVNQGLHIIINERDQEVRRLEKDIAESLKPMIANLVEVDIRIRDGERKLYTISIDIDEAEIVRSRYKRTSNEGLLHLCRATAKMLTFKMHMFILGQVK